MKYFREPAQQIGWLFVLATVTGVLSVVVMSSTLGAENLLSAVHSDQASLLAGHMLLLVMLTAMVGTAVLLYPILRIHNERLALSYLLARTLEVTMITVGLVAGLLLVPLSWEYAAAGSADMASAQVLAQSLKAASDWTGYLGAQIIFSLTALLLNWAFFRNALIPRWLSVWGLIGVPLMFASGVLVMFESLNSDASTLNLLVVPLAVQEMAMAFWLIVRGFSNVTTGEPVSQILDLQHGSPMTKNADRRSVAVPNR